MKLVPSTHRRVTDRLVSFWQDLAKNGGMPAEDDINPAMLKHVWPYCFLIAVPNGSADAYHYEFLGHALFSAVDYSAPNAQACERILAVDSALIRQAINRAIISEQPAEWNEEFRASDARDYRQRGCVLPLCSSKEKAVRYLLGGLNWRSD